jgi:DNA-binding beta-propeller fold protein YncE
VLKFRRDGSFLLQIGRAGRTGGSNHEALLGRPADVAVDPETNEVFVADGYLNRRIAVFDAATGATGGTGEPTARDRRCRPRPYDPDARQRRSSALPSTRYGSPGTASSTSPIA